MAATKNIKLTNNKLAITTRKFMEEHSEPMRPLRTQQLFLKECIPANRLIKNSLFEFKHFKITCIKLRRPAYPSGFEKCSQFLSMRS